ncbi:hypothetical protein EWM64_g8300 [Hericium alpestre]|uniref:Protein kinase domain-containing protein n=1 Tax=Hericium alpestre TaxID=135208 RepID=A0A4Y9ZLR2_9AGAM|nr:hypothetical protein EWM64_g8300 [Hericium alpestre]
MSTTIDNYKSPDSLSWPGWLEDAQETGIWDESQPVAESFKILERPEVQWRHVQPWLESQGYMLRPRFRPGWIPSWTKKKNASPVFFEDSVKRVATGAGVAIDAIQISTGRRVCLKRIPGKAEDSNELKITQFLSDLRDKDPRNHSVPLLDVIHAPDHIFLVFPLYRTLINGAEKLDTLGEGFDFVDQTLEVVTSFYVPSVLFKSAIYRVLFFFMRWVSHIDALSRDARGQRLTGVRTRTQVGGVKYYYTDFGESMRFESSDNVRIDVWSKAGIHAPETKGRDRPPYDPFKADIYTLGTVYTTLFLKEYERNFNVLTPLLNEMTSNDPALRPSAAQALSKFREIKSSFSRTALHARVRRGTTPETGAQRIFRGGWHWLKQYAYAARNFKW